MNNLFIVGLLLVFIGFTLAFIAILTLVVRGRTRGGGLVLIGPIPIVFGTDKETVKWLMVLAIAIILVAALVFYAPFLLGW